MSKYKYTESEQETFKVLKMQKEQLDKLEQDVKEDASNADKDASDLVELRKRAEALLKKKGNNAHAVKDHFTRD